MTGEGQQAGGVQVVVLEVAGQWYGVRAGQVHSIVAPACDKQAADQAPEGGGCWLCDDQEVPIVPLARWLGLDAAAAAAPPVAPRLLLCRGRDGLRAFEVEMPQDIVTLPPEAIFPLPILIRRLLPASPLWGIGLDATPAAASQRSQQQRSQRLLLLVDPAADLEERVGS